MPTPAQTYQKDGYLSPVPILTPAQAHRHHQILEAAERRLGPLHYWAKIHTILRSPYRLATHPAMLNIVEQILGPNILLYNATYIIKEPNSPAHVSWHQDLTYWGLDDDAQVSAWLALTPADETSGCMRMLPGSHKTGPRPHDTTTPDPTNVLYQSQTIHDVPEAQATLCPLNPGEASFHHGWTLHSSAPNRSNHRRIGLNIQYIAPHVRQTKLPGYTALLIRGKDPHRHYPPETPAQKNLQPPALAWRAAQEKLHQNIAGKAN